MKQTYKILHGDCRDRLKQLPDNSVDSVVTDPPYELGFMGKKWDASGIAYNVDMWKEVLRVLKPGGHLLAFGGTRTHHRMTCAIEDAGFDIRDELDWFYGSGFPKSLNVSKAIDEAAGVTREVVGHRTDGRYAYEFEGTANRPTGARADTEDAERIGGFVSDKSAIMPPVTDAAKQWDGWGTALKPGREPIVLARKPLDMTVAECVQTYGTGALNIDGCRIAIDADDDIHAKNPHNMGGLDGENNIYGACTPTMYKVPDGRWPANILFSHSESCALVGYNEPSAVNAQRSGEDTANASYTHDGSTRFAMKPGVRRPQGGGEVWDCAPDCPVAELDRQSGITKSGAMKHEVGAYAGESNVPFLRGRSGPSNQHGDSGGASRFFYVAKPSRTERDAGLDHLVPRSAGEVTGGRKEGSKGLDSPRAGAGRQTKEGVRNTHPTVKPIQLMRYLVRLITPPNGLVLDPFTGSGSTACACMLEDMNFIGIELDAHHIEIAKGRIEYWKRNPELPKKTSPKVKKAPVVVEEEGLF